MDYRERERVMTNADTNTTGPQEGNTMTETKQVAKVTVYDNVTMSTENRCDRCGAQAYVEVQLKSSPDHPLLFCAHHADENWKVLVTLESVIADHRPMLHASTKGANAPA